MAEFVHQESFDLFKELAPEGVELLKQFGLLHSLVAGKFSFSQKFDPNNSIQFVNDLFSSDEFQKNFPLPNITGERNIYVRGKKQVQIQDIQITAKNTNALMPALSK